MNLGQDMEIWIWVLAFWATHLLGHICRANPFGHGPYKYRNKIKFPLLITALILELREFSALSDIKKTQTILTAGDSSENSADQLSDIKKTQTILMAGDSSENSADQLPDIKKTQPILMAGDSSENSPDQLPDLKKRKEILMAGDSSENSADQLPDIKKTRRILMAGDSSGNSADLLPDLKKRKKILMEGDSSENSADQLPKTRRILMAGDSSENSANQLPDLKKRKKILMAGDSSENSLNHLPDLKKRRKSSKEKSDDLWYEHIFDKFEKLEKKINKKLKQDEETEEEMSDQGSESDELEEKVGDEVEVYAGAIKSGTDEDEDEEDNNTEEVYSTSYDPDMNLDNALNDIMYAPGDLYLKASAVFESGGLLLYWTHAFPQVNPEEIWRAFDLGGNRELHISGEMYMMIKAEPYLMCGGGVAIFRTHNTLVFGLSDDPIISRECIDRIRKMADYMKQLGM